MISARTNNNIVYFNEIKQKKPFNYRVRGLQGRKLGKNERKWVKIEVFLIFLAIICNFVVYYELFLLEITII